MRGFTRDTGAAGVGFGTTLDVPQVHGHSLTGSPTIDTLRSRPAVIGVAIVAHWRTLGLLVGALPLPVCPTVRDPYET